MGVPALAPRLGEAAMTISRTNFVKGFAVAIGLLVVGGASGYWWAHRGMSSPSMPATSSAGNSLSPASAPASKRKILYWRDPMVPNAKFDKPGKSPFMDMQLVPVYADEAAAAGEVRVDPTVVQNLGIRLGKVEKA